MSQSAHPGSVTGTWRPKNGVTLFDNYQLLGVVGQGGMGTVYKAFHLSLKRFVALKVLRIDQIPSPDLVIRFLREMQAVGQMDHPNVVRAADAGKRNGVFYLIMEYLDGADLSRLVAERGPLGTSDACELARQTAVGLDYIHQTLVHRDVKPSNLILTTTGLVKVLDLGLARLHEVGADGGEFTPTGSAVGTYYYLAPEQAVASSRVDGRADIYSLGCTLFKLLTGRPPYPGPDYDSAARKLHAHGHVPLTAAPNFPSVPEALRPVLLRMTAKNPADRCQSAREAAEALAPFAAGSRPQRLLAGAQEGLASPLQPLPSQAPEDLMRLTQSAQETPATSSGAAESHTVVRPTRPRRLWMIGAVALLTCTVVVAAWFLAPDLIRWWGSGRPTTNPISSQPNPSDPPSPTEPRALDALAVHEYHPLLDQPPLPAWSVEGLPPTWRWDGGRQRVDVSGPETLLLLVGTTARPNFIFETGVEQAPWTGQVGLFWGYHEDADAKAARKPDREFARFQMLCVAQEFQAGRGNTYSVQRVQCGLRYNVRGEVHYRADVVNSQDVLAPAGEAILHIEVVHDRLLSACFGSVNLTGLCSDAANDHFKTETSGGGLGLVTLSNSVQFSDARFLGYEGK